MFRELGFSLDEARALIDASRKREALHAQHAVVLERRRHMDALLEAINATLHALEITTSMNTDTMFNGNERFANGEYAEVAKTRWSDQEPWKTSKRRTSGYAKDDWARIEAEADAINAEFLVAMQQLHSTDSPEAQSLAERHRLHIDRWFYACSHAMHVQVASLYTADPRFQAHYDAHSPGLAAYIESAIRANAEARTAL